MGCHLTKCNLKECCLVHGEMPIRMQHGRKAAEVEIAYELKSRRNPQPYKDPRYHTAHTSVDVSELNRMSDSQYLAEESFSSQLFQRRSRRVSIASDELNEKYEFDPNVIPDMQPVAETNSQKKSILKPLE